MSKLISDCIRVDDFKTLKHLVLFRNDTSGTSCLDSDKIHLLEMSKTILSLRAPVNSCRESHGLTLYIFKFPLVNELPARLQEGKTPKGSIELIGKVKEVLEVENGTSKKNTECTVRIELTQFDAKLWNGIIKEYESVQEKIDNMIRIGKD